MTWYDQLLAAMGAPDSAASATSLQLWAQSEGVPDSWNNWLATTLTCCGGTDVNSAGVKQYPTVSDGVNATLQTLQGGAYRAVTGAFISDAGPAAIWAAVNSSPWCAGCQGGNYPIALYNYVHGGGAGPQPGTGPQEPTIGPGATGRPVRVLQRRLDDLGHHLAITGVYDQAVTDTVREFQRTHGLTPDGITGPATWAQLLALTNATPPPPGPPPPGDVAPSQAPEGIDGRVLTAWGLLGERTGAIAVRQLRTMAAVQDQMRGHRR